MLSVFTPDLCAPRWPCAVRKSAAWTELSARPLSWRSKTSYLLYVYNMYRPSWIGPCMRRHFNWEKTLHLAKCSATNSSETKTALRSYLKTCQLGIFLKWQARSKSSCPVDTKPLVPLGLEISDPACNAKLTWLRPHVTGVPIKGSTPSVPFPALCSLTVLKIPKSHDPQRTMMSELLLQMNQMLWRFDIFSAIRGLIPWRSFVSSCWGLHTSAVTERVRAAAFSLSSNKESVKPEMWRRNSFSAVYLLATTQDMVILLKSLNFTGMTTSHDGEPCLQGHQKVLWFPTINPKHWHGEILT